jgi:hypothetical protein
MKQLIKFTVNNADYKIAVPSAATTSIYSSMSTKDMTAAFLDAINKQRNNIKRFIRRKPVLETVSKLKTTEGESIKGCLTIEEMIDVFTSARKTISCKLVVDESSYDQMFGINFDTGMIVLYKKEWENTFEMIGSMPYDTIYSNWADLFFPEHPETEEEEFDIDELKDSEISESSGSESKSEIKSKRKHFFTESMMEQLDEPAFEMWNWFYNLMDIRGQVIIEYSGSGDSGAIDDIIVEGTVVTTELRDKIEELCWKLIDSKESGFYNNDGGYGEIIITESKFSWKHYNYITDTHQSVDDEVDLSADAYKSISYGESIPYESMPTAKPIDPIAGTAIHSTLEDMVRSYKDVLLSKGEWVPKDSYSTEGTDESKDLLS